MDEVLETRLGRAKALLDAGGYPVLPGMSGAQLCRAERFYGVEFPPDLRALLETFRPRAFCDWTDFSSENVERLRRRLARPVEGLLYDVEENGFWLPAWGARPAETADALAAAAERLGQVPALVPLFGHRYLPCVPCRAGNPVYSVHQSDIICYGGDLWEYLEVEFGGKDPQTVDAAGARRDVPFWGALVS